MRLYHFMCAEYGLLALREQRLKISRLDQQNDPFELFADAQEDRVRRDQVRAERAAIAKQWGMVCFCRDWHDPALWAITPNVIKACALASKCKRAFRSTLLPEAVRPS